MRTVAGTAVEAVRTVDWTAEGNLLGGHLEERGNKKTRKGVSRDGAGHGVVRTGTAGCCTAAVVEVESVAGSPVGVVTWLSVGVTREETFVL